MRKLLLPIGMCFMFLSVAFAQESIGLDSYISKNQIKESKPTQTETKHTSFVDRGLANDFGIVSIEPQYAFVGKP